MREINSAGLALLRRFESCKLTAYQDSGGVWTIGYGHTGPEVCEGMVYTQNQAELQLQQDLEKFYTLDHYLTEIVNDNMYSALICLAFNVGLRAVRLSNTLRLVNDGKSPDKEWLGFDHVNGVEVPGLKRRRQAELELYHTLG